MVSTSFLSTKTRKPEMTAFLVFLAFSLIVRFWGDSIAHFVLDISALEIEDVVLFERVKIVMLGLATTLFAMGVYVVLIKYNTKRRSQTLAREMVSDLMLSREQFRMLYDNSPVPYFLMDDEGSIRNPNKATLRFLGGTTEECETANFYNLLDPEQQGGAQTSLIHTKVNRVVPVSKEEVHIRTLTGTYRWAQASIFSLDKKSQIPFKHLVTLVDITQEKQSDEVKTDFLLLASHQLRTPATTVKWYVDYLLNNEELKMTGIVREYLEEIYTGNERMINLITTLLTVSRIEMGTLAPDYQSIHIDEVLKDIMAELAQDLKKKNLQVNVQSEGDDKVTTDSTMIRIALQNLLTNAIKYTDKGGSIFVETLYDVNKCTLSVSDTGHGIPIEEQDKIFTKMFRATNARKVSASGTGLGLYLTKAFVEKLGGTIEFMSQPEKGAKFTIALPRVAPDA